jgi:cytochrome c-type biogenesis protein CcmH/NrfG
MSEQAEDAYLSAIRFDPNLISAYVRLSSMYVATGNYDKAIDLLKQARDIRPRNVEITSMAGRAAIMKRDFPGAVDLLTEAVRLDSTDLLLRNDLATALMLSRRRDEAVAQWREILARNPGPDLAQTVLENLRRAESDTTGS